MKKVIFIGGTEFSGTTFFHMILANDAHGLALGEAQNFMRPLRPYHFNMHCSCGEHPCAIWQKLKDAGEEQLYSTAFSLFPDVDFIVDSSKNPFWIQDQMRTLRRQGIETQQILIWKTPYELAQSFFKRGILETWEKSWVNYHRLYFTFFEQSLTIPYWDLANNRDALRAVCNYLSIADYPGKERYWERPQHVVGGNPSARVHLYSADNENFQENVQRSTSKIEVAEDGTHRRIYYEGAVDPAVRQAVDSAIRENSQIPAMVDLLQAKDVRNQVKEGGAETVLEVGLRIPEPYIRMRRFKYASVRRAAGLRYGS